MQTCEQSDAGVRETACGIIFGGCRCSRSRSRRYVVCSRLGAAVRREFCGFVEMFSAATESNSDRCQAVFCQKYHLHYFNYCRHRLGNLDPDWFLAEKKRIKEKNWENNSLCGGCWTGFVKSAKVSN